MIGMRAASATAAKWAEDAVFVGAQADAVIRGHQHQHRGAERRGAAAPLGGNPRAEVAARDDHGHASGDVRQAQRRAAGRAHRP
jgi:hypothetical protein